MTTNAKNAESRNAITHRIKMKILVCCLALTLASPIAYTKKVDAKAQDMRCMQANIFFEARGESRLGKLAVAKVTTNRKDSKQYPNSVCKVVFQPWQFSWTKQLSWKRIQQVMDGSTKGMKAKDRLALKEAQELAWTALEGPVTILPSSVLHYHALSVQPYWAKKMQKHKVIGQHVFYKQKGKK